MTIIDRSEFNPQDYPPDCTGVILRAGHGFTEDKLWREMYVEAVRRAIPVGFYHVPESSDARANARFFAYICRMIPGPGATLGWWLDFAVGDVPGSILNAPYVDSYRATFDTGLYSNMAGLAALGHTYDRFERLWVAGTASPARWLMRQPGGLDGGFDIDVAADLGGGVRPGWTGFGWPNP